MKQLKSNLVPISVLVMLSIWGFIALYRRGYIPNGLDVLIFAMIMIGGVYAFVVQMRRYKDIKSGFPPDDELSTQIKYKAGYYAFITSMYVWLFVLLFQRHFGNVDVMLGFGILLSAVISIAIKAYLTRHYHENQN
jgi:hypothetical protein